MLVDANLLLYAVDTESPHHGRTSRWPMEALNGDRRVGLPWQTVGAFLRISTYPRMSTFPLSPDQARRYVEQWLAADPVWIPPATERTASVLADLINTTGVTANLVPDAQLAALAIEHGLTVHSADTDFGRFPDAAWLNPLQG